MARNKAHKQRFSSKHKLSGKSKGRSVNINNVRGKGFISSFVKGKLDESMLKRKNDGAVNKKMRTEDNGVTPRIIGVIPANEIANTSLIIQGLSYIMGVQMPTKNFPFTATSKDKKTAFTFVWETQFNDQNCIDIVKVADFVVLVLDASQTTQEEIRDMQDIVDIDEDGRSIITATTWFGDIGLCITEFTRHIISSMNAQGVPSVVVVLQNLDSFSEKHRQKVLRVHQRYFASVLPDTTKTFTIIEDNDYNSLLRHLQVTKLRPILWREQHPYLVVEEGSYDCDTQKLIIGGYLRGMSLSAKQLMHITNYGTYQIESISIRNMFSGNVECIDLSNIEQRESLEHIQANATLDDIEGPTEEDVRYHQMMGTKKIRVPEGVSDYQAAWYDLEENEITEEQAITHNNNLNDDAVVEFENLSHWTSKTDVNFLKVNDIIRLESMTDEERMAEIQRIREESEQEMYNPDMVETPLTMPARHRFAKYRGLKSFQTGKWDTTENLPSHYACIYKLQGLTRIKEAALKKCAEGAASVGQYIYITLVGVLQDILDRGMLCGHIIASGQLEHEQKWSVLHFQVQRASEWEEPIKSKTHMLAHIGFRKFYVSPIFSDITTSDRSKFARFFHSSENFCMASFYGPISYQPCPILFFETPSLEEQIGRDSSPLVCFGRALPPNPDLLILKRAVLTGRVATIHKKQIVVKYMFFNNEDVCWFQPVDLHTRLGRRGKITKAVGTHGLFKASFNDQIMQHDLVCMDLYKRVFPKWTTIPFIVTESADYLNAMT